MSDRINQAQKFLAGADLPFEVADALWNDLKKNDELSLAWSVLERMRKDGGTHLVHGLPNNRNVLDKLCRQQALLISKDQELGAGVRHERAIKVLCERFPLDDSTLDTDAETLGIAGGIYKRKWEDLGRYQDLKQASEFYSRASGNAMGDDAYVQINAAYLEDLVAAASAKPSPDGELPGNHLRKRIADELPVSESWWNTATRAEALLGLGRYSDAAEVLRSKHDPPQPWELQTTARQLANLAHLREKKPLQNPAIQSVFEALLPGASPAVCSVTIGKVGLALSGGGFRASFYHLGVLARLAELDVLRHVEVLSCVSGGSIIGACYWLALRNQFLEKPTMTRGDYVALVGQLISTFEESVAEDLRGLTQPSMAVLALRLLRSKEKQGVLSPEDVAEALEKHFLAAHWDANSNIFMDQLAFTPKDHSQALTGSPTFDLGKHNWMRANKVPALVLNATSVNTGRGWQFTSTWMGESPWAINEGADNIERLQWAPYSVKANWRIRLARAVAASAAVPGIFSPLELGPSYPDVRVQLVDGGVNDNQGVASLLAMNCNVLLVSDAAGQLRLEREPTPGLKGFVSYANRAMDVLMERVRQATFADLSARKISGAIRGLMFVHMKAGLDADTIRLPFSQATFAVERSVLSASGVRKDFQRALAELRTDLNAFTITESRALMACGYEMARHGFEKQAASDLPELWNDPAATDWVFSEMREEITSTETNTDKREERLAALRRGSAVKL